MTNNRIMMSSKRMMKFFRADAKIKQRIVAKAVSKMFNTFPMIISENLYYGIVESNMAMAFSFAEF